MSCKKRQHVYRRIEALSYFSAHQLLVHLVHVPPETIQSFCPAGRPLLLLLITFLLTIIIQIV